MIMDTTTDNTPPHPTQQQGRDSEDELFDLWFDEIICDSPHGDCRDR
jgi:hypothetical protein